MTLMTWTTDLNVTVVVCPSHARPATLALAPLGSVHSASQLCRPPSVADGEGHDPSPLLTRVTPSLAKTRFRPQRFRVEFQWFFVTQWLLSLSHSPRHSRLSHERARQLHSKVQTRTPPNFCTRTQSSNNIPALMLGVKPI